MKKSRYVSWSRACVGTLLPLVLTALTGLSGCIESTGMTAFEAPHRHRVALDQDFGLTELPVGKADAHDFTVRVYRSGADRGAGSCTGALISPSEVVTALHCVVELNAQGELTDVVRDVADLHVEFGGDYLPWGRVPVVDIRTCGEYHFGAAHDVAVIELGAPAPADVPILRVASEPPEEGDAFASYGFGSEITRVIPDTNFKVESVHRHARRHRVKSIADATIAFEGGTIHGDSGGPLIDRRTGELVAIVSEGSENFEAPNPTAPASGPIDVTTISSEKQVTIGARLDACPMLFSK